ncbi:MAG TPA: type IV secretion system protein [Burkholderiaceae bacterium]|nr:type IV secretion system protein [Burkholderiaceae bacterium]
MVPARAAVGSDALAANRAWEIDREMLLARSERRAWRVAMAAVAVCLLAIGADVTRGALRQTVPIPILIDKATGETTVQLPLSSSTVPVDDAVDKHFAVQFVTAREEYDWSWLNRDYNTVARMAAPEVFAPFAGMFSGQKGQNITDKLSDRIQWRVAIVGVRFPPMAPTPTTTNVRMREAYVTFDRQAYDVHEKANVGPAQRFVASLRFEYRPKLVQTDAERIENPLGFLVTAYRVDAEFASGSPPSERAGAPSAGALDSTALEKTQAQLP